jgi:L,D-peptidoglycan transpeptidase YkuD (ErfK/YbiS/YcfS/YnhG family)
METKNWNEILLTSETAAATELQQAPPKARTELQQSFSKAATTATELKLKRTRYVIYIDT